MTDTEAVARTGAAAGEPDAATPDAAALDVATAEFTEHRDLIFAIAYNLIGSVADTEDVLQETWLSWAGAARDQVANARAYLVRIAVNEALARLTRRRREVYVGPWLPEPLLTQADFVDHALRAESVSLAMMVVLETLTPLERAVFVLHDVFGYDHAEIATTLGRTRAAVRQLAHRARTHVRDRHVRYRPESRTQQAATERFLAAALGGDLAALLDMLAPDVAMWSDAGGHRSAARRVIRGRDKVLRLIASAVDRLPAALTVRYLDVNGGPAAVLFAGEAPYAVIVVDLRPGDDRVRGIYGVTNPDKLLGLSGSGAAAARRDRRHGDLPSRLNWR
jgi:RNA polymerase sigma factor (sigma-70 family)